MGFVDIPHGMYNQLKPDDEVSKQNQSSPAIVNKADLRASELFASGDLHYIKSVDLSPIGGRWSG